MDTGCKEDKPRPYNPFDDSSPQTPKSKCVSPVDSVDNPKPIDSITSNNNTALNKLRKSYKENYRKPSRKRSSDSSTTGSRSDSGDDCKSSSKSPRTAPSSPSSKVSRKETDSRESSKKRSVRDDVVSSRKSRKYDSFSRSRNASKKHLKKHDSGNKRSRSKHRRYSKDRQRSRKCSRKYHSISSKRRRTSSSISSNESYRHSHSKYSPTASRHHHPRSSRRRSISTEKIPYYNNVYPDVQRRLNIRSDHRDKRYYPHSHQLPQQHEQQSSSTIHSSPLSNPMPHETYDRNSRIRSSVNSEMARHHSSAKSSYIDRIRVANPTSYVSSSNIITSHPSQQQMIVSRHHKVARTTNLIEIIPTSNSQADEPNVIWSGVANQCDIGHAAQNSHTIAQTLNKFQQCHKNIDDDHRSNTMQVLNTTTANDSPLSADSATVNSQESFNIGGLSDCLVEEMLREEELKQIEENRLLEEQALNEDRLAECRLEMQSMLDVISIVNDRLCSVAFLERELENYPKKCTAYPDSQKPFKVMSWLCNVKTGDLERSNQQNQEEYIMTSEIVKDTVPNILTPPVDESTVRTIVENNPVQVKKPNAPVKRQYDQPSDIDALMQKIFRKKESSKVDSWLKTDDHDETIDDSISDGDEPYDPEVEEERLQSKLLKKGTVQMNHNLSSISAIEDREQLSSANEFNKLERSPQRPDLFPSVIIGDMCCSIPLRFPEFGSLIRGFACSVLLSQEYLTMPNRMNIGAMPVRSIVSWLFLSSSRIYENYNGVEENFTPSQNIHSNFELKLLKGSILQSLMNVSFTNQNPLIIELPPVSSAVPILTSIRLKNSKSQHIRKPSVAKIKEKWVPNKEAHFTSNGSTESSDAQGTIPANDVSVYPIDDSNFTYIMNENYRYPLQRALELHLEMSKVLNFMGHYFVARLELEMTTDKKVCKNDI
ncbi:hypothetical protein GJ496_006456 [Pomphorhynchus laevis]|nr:hypothetical protein GJ496_006456 [Pomphorhynchus laevis]